MTLYKNFSNIRWKNKLEFKMDIASIIFLAVGLTMDAFSVSITRGLILKCNIKYALIIAIFIGGFQALMPVFGWFSGM